MTPPYFLLFQCTYIISAYPYYMSQTSLSFNNADLYCNIFCNSTLASIHSSDDYDSIISILSPYKNTWIGLYINTESHLTWIDASDYDYAKWKSSLQPIRDTNTNKNCVQINKDNVTYWEMAQCDIRQYFVCNECIDATFEPTLEPTMEPTFVPTLNPTFIDDDGSLEGILLTDYWWLIFIGGSLVLLAICCAVCICYQRKKQFNKAINHKNIDKYRKHIKNVSKMSYSIRKLTVPKGEMVIDNSINLEMMENNRDTVGDNDGAMTHLTTPRTHKTETSLADLVIGDDAMSPSNNIHALIDELSGSMPQSDVTPMHMVDDYNYENEPGFNVIDCIIDNDIRD